MTGLGIRHYAWIAVVTAMITASVGNKDLAHRRRARRQRDNGR